MKTPARPRLLLACLTLLGIALTTTARSQEPTPAASATPGTSEPLLTPELRQQLFSPAPPPGAVSFLPGAANSPISAGVALPAGQALLLTSGTVPPVLDEQAPAGSRARYGDTQTQGAGALRAIEAQLKKAGLSLLDVVYLRVYLAPDKAQDGRFDYPGWFAAYGQFFGTAANPVKPARSTVGVASLVNPDWLIEIEAVAAYPPKAPPAPGQ